MKLELGISTFGETTPLETTGEAISHAQRIRDLVKEIELADEVGLDVYAIGEHHRDDYAVSVPEVILAAGAVNTKHIKLSSAVTVLSSSDPVRVYQNFATVDALSNGRAEVMVGRGSFIESFPLFGYDLTHYEELFDEKLDMLLNINDNEIVDWRGRFTQSIDNKGVYPRAVHDGKLPIWVGTGGNMESTLKIAKKGLPIAYATIGGDPTAFKPLAELYRKVAKASGYEGDQIKVSAHSWGFIADNTVEAIEKNFYPTKVMMDNVAKDRPHWSALTWDNYLASVSDTGAIFAGNPQVVAQKIIRLVEALNLDRFLLHLPLGSLPHEDVLHAIRLYGEQVAPIVRAHFENK